MKVILKEDLSNLGAAGDVVDVKAGYARNYLIPQGLAYLASAGNIRRLEDERKRGEEKSRKDFLEARRRASQLEGASVTFQARASEEGKLFGSVTNADISEALKKQGFDIPKAAIRMPQGPLKNVGDHALKVALHADVVVSITVSVLGEQ